MNANVTASMVNLPREDFSEDLSIPGAAAMSEADALLISIGNDVGIEEDIERKSLLSRALISMAL